MISRREIAAVLSRIAPRIRQTPVVDVLVGPSAKPVSLKLEVLQHTGTFKVRGAFSNLLGRDLGEAGVAAASGGNHGAAVAYAAAELGVKATIFVPTTSSPAKVDRIRSYGADVVQEGAGYVDALARCERFAAETGALAVHAYDAEPTVAGQGTIALELEDQRPDVDTVLVAVGGGGLIAGVAAWYSGGIKVVSVETEGCPTLARAVAAGAPVDIEPAGIARDSLGASRIGSIAFEIARSHVHDCVLVSDGAVRKAQSWLWDEARVVAEPGGATAFAALHSGAYVRGPGERVAVIVCGANVDLAGFARGLGDPPA